MRQKKSKLNHIWTGIGSQDEFVGYGMGNPYSPKVIIVEESPSQSHKQVPWLEPEMSGEEYVSAHRENRPHLESWPMFEKFVTPLSEYLDFDLLQHAWITSAVKSTRPSNPSKKKERWFREEFEKRWHDILREELAAFNEIPILTVGKLATEATASALDLTLPSKIEIMQPEWWGPTPIASDRDVAHAIHWYAPLYDSSREPKYYQSLGVVSSWLSHHI